MMPKKIPSRRATTTEEVRRGPKPRTVVTSTGELRVVPSSWDLLPPGDATLTRRVKAAGPAWAVIEHKRGKKFSHGLWAEAAVIATERARLEEERRDPAYERRLTAGRERRAKAEGAYAVSFGEAVRAFLAFAPRYEQLERRMAELIAAHATPVGSGTVARTQRIPLEERAEAATIAWMRHQTTAYDHMEIPRVAGARREVRRQLARRSKELLRAYREGKAIDSRSCPLHAALRRS
jgi:hypothetical protein